MSHVKIIKLNYRVEKRNVTKSLEAYFVLILFADTFPRTMDEISKFSTFLHYESVNINN